MGGRIRTHTLIFDSSFDFSNVSVSSSMSHLFSIFRFFEKEVKRNFFGREVLCRDKKERERVEREREKRARYTKKKKKLDLETCMCVQYSLKTHTHNNNKHTEREVFALYFLCGTKIQFLALLISRHFDKKDRKHK